MSIHHPIRLCKTVSIHEQTNKDRTSESAHCASIEGRCRKGRDRRSALAHVASREAIDRLSAKARLSKIAEHLINFPTSGNEFGDRSVCIEREFGRTSNGLRQR